MAEVLIRHPDRERFIRTLPDTERQVLAAMVRRRQLIAILVAERNRLYTAHPQSRKSINIIVKGQEDELARINEDMKGVRMLSWAVLLRKTSCRREISGLGLPATA